MPSHPQPGPAPASEAHVLARLRHGLGGVVGASELFLPLDDAGWRSGRLRIPRAARIEARSRIRGVRFHAADPKGEQLDPERATQRDVVGLIDGLRAVRGEPELGDVVLDRRATLARRPRAEEGRRARFGLQRGGPRGADETRAARCCHRRIERAIARSGLVVLEPRSFDATKGLVGLREWGSRLRLGRRRSRLPWLLLLLLPLLGLIECEAPVAPEPPSDFFGVTIEHRSLLLLVDVSGSMERHFETVRAEAHRLLDEWAAGRGERHANVIAYHGQARSALGGIRPLTTDNVAALKTFVDALGTGSGTHLRSGLQRAAEEVAAHAHPTTLIILTDAQDGSIEPMIAGFDELKNAFGGIEFRGHGLTPRLFGDGVDATPKDEQEQRFARLTELLGGGFGTREGSP